MKLVKSLLLGSAAGVLAVASSQAADLPYRKAAPVEYVKICDAHGVGFWYIPGTDTCLHVGGNVTFDYRYFNASTRYEGWTLSPTGVVASGGFTPGRLRDSEGWRARGRIQLDARNTTAVGTLRTFISAQFDYKAGQFVSGGGLAATAGSNAPSLDKAYIQWAGLTAGYYQSVFDFWADDWPFTWDLRDSDSSIVGIAYTATFGGGFSATISAEDRSDRLTPYSSGNLFGGAASALTRGEYVPDIVGQIELTQSWGTIHLSGAAHDQSSSVVADEAGIPTGPIFANNNSWGFAVLGGVKFNLPVLAAGDEFWVEGEYTSGALSYQQVAPRSFNGNGVIQSDYDSIWYLDPFGGVHVNHPTSWSVMAAFQHYFTPNFIGRIFGSYLNVRYNGAAVLATGVDAFEDGNGALSTSSWNEWHIGGQLVWEPIKSFDLGVELAYAHAHQSIPAGVGPANINTWEGALHIERDF